MKKVESIECYWTTTNDPNFHELQKIMGYTLTKENGLILGIVNDRNNNYPEDHVLCGIEVDSRLVLFDIRSFNFLTPHKYDVKMSNKSHIGEGTFSSIGYMESCFSNCKIKRGEFTAKEIPTQEEIIERIHMWMQHTDAPSLYFFKFVLDQLEDYLKQEKSKRKTLDNFLSTLRLKPEKRNITEKNYFDIINYIKSEIIDFPVRTLRPAVES